MQVFKLYFKIIQKGFSSIIIYFCIFLTFILAFATDYQEQIQDNTNIKIKIEFINQDKQSNIINGLENYLKNQYNLVSNSFFQQTDYIIIVPNGFTENWEKKNKIIVKQKIGIDIINTIQIEMTINQYFMFLRQNKRQTVETQLLQDKKDFRLNFLVKYSNCLSYVLISVMIVSISMVMVSFNRHKIKKRNLCSTISTLQINMQLVLANLVYMIVFIGILLLFGVALCPNFKIDAHVFCLFLNIIIFSISVLSISFLVGVCVQKKIVRDIAANLLSVGLCLISGVFFSQSTLNKNILEIAKFTPVYWYVKANNAIGNLDLVSFPFLKEIFICIFIEFGFAITICSISLVVKKQNE